MPTRTKAQPFEDFYRAANFSGMIRSGLKLITARHVQQRSQARPLLKWPSLCDAALFGLFVGGPALALDMFQRVYTGITGQPRAFAQGSWQFYLQFGLREDLAHHTNETVGYFAKRPQGATDLDDLTAWVMTVAQFLWSYDDLMGAVWDEAVLLNLLEQYAQELSLSEHPLFARLGRQWETQRPYYVPLNGTYADVRKAAFQAFLTPRIDQLPDTTRREMMERYQALYKQERTIFQQQMSLLAYMVPGRFTDEKAPLPLWQAQIAVILNGHYFSIGIAARDADGNVLAYGPQGRHFTLETDGERLFGPNGRELYLNGDQLYLKDNDRWAGYLDLVPVSQVKAVLQTAMAQKHADWFDPSTQVDILLAETPRRDQPYLRSLLQPEVQHAVEALSRTPIIINWDVHARDQSLAEVRRTQRGIGDHGLTIIRTESSIVFDEHHVFFDGTWAVAMAEVLTNAAVHWCERSIAIAPGSPTPSTAPLCLEAPPVFVSKASARRMMPEVSAETTIHDITQVLNLRRILANKGMNLTVNDLLVISRIFHAAHYRPSKNIQAAVDALRGSSSTNAAAVRAAQLIERSLERGRVLNPALLIPVEATLVSPRERIFPITFRTVTDELVWSWDEAWDAYQAYRRIEPPDTPQGLLALKRFLTLRETLLTTLLEFSHYLAASKQVALRGESFNVAVMKLLCHLPAPLQYTLRTIPEQFPALNEIIRGDEVYSNVGRVVENATLTRFMSAKDDGHTKALVWGIMTDDQGRMVVTMRDFRPHVLPLVQAGKVQLAREMALDYVRAYTADFIGLVARLSAMLQVEPLKRS